MRLVCFAMCAMAVTAFGCSAEASVMTFTSLTQATAYYNTLLQAETSGQSMDFSSGFYSVGEYYDSNGGGTAQTRAAVPIWQLV